MASLDVYNDFAHKKSVQGYFSATNVHLGPSLPQNLGPSKAATSWLQTVVKAAESRSQEGLFKLLRGSKPRQASDHTVPTLNQARGLISKSLPQAWNVQKQGAGGGGDGSGTPAAAAAKASLYLYQRCLHKVLLSEIHKEASFQGFERAEDLPAEKRDAVIAHVLARAEVQRGLVNACVEVAVFVYMESPEEESFPRATIAMGRERHWCELLQGIWWVQSGLGAAAVEEGIPAMHEDVTAYLALIQQRILEELLFSANSSIYMRMEIHLQSKQRGDVGPLKPLDADTALLEIVLNKVFGLASGRVVTLCTALCDLAGMPSKPGGEKVAAAFTAAVRDLVLSVLCSHIDILFRRHLTAIILGAIFCTARMHGIAVKFRSLTDLAPACLPCHDSATFQHVLLCPVQSALHDDDIQSAPELSSNTGSVREFYNAVLLPVVQLYDKETLFGSTSEDLDAAVADGPPHVTLERSKSSAQQSVASQPEAPLSRSKAGKPKTRVPFSENDDNNVNTPVEWI